MKKNLPKLLISFLFALACLQTAKAQTPPKVELQGTQVLTYTSKTVDGQEYRLYINLPGNYTRDSTKSYPVVYLLDAQYDFPTFTGIYGSQYYDGFIPGIITVGITWGGNNPNVSQLRARDFTPTKIAQTPSGGGPKFLAFIKTELIPLIKSKYRVTDDRTLVGSSYGGLFTLYTLFNDPSLFDRYILTSPSLTFDNSVLRSWETKYESTGSPMASRLFIARGAFEDLETEFNALTDRLKKVKNLEVQALTFANTGHSGTKPEGFSRGLQWAFKRPSVKLDPAILKKYTGLYVVKNDTARIVVKDGNLVAQSKSNDFVFQAENENSFYHDGIFLRANFQLDNAGNVKGLKIEQYDGEIFYQRIK
nr:alpha/beta hydrolase-fold protein [uncultured Mucilaginibacter sp.]